MKTTEEIKTDLSQHLTAQVEIAGSGLLISKEKLIQAAQFLKDHADYKMDYISNLCAVDYPKENYIEVVYNFYSIEKKEGPVTLKARTDREKNALPSLTPLFRGAEFQEREAYDLFGVHFEGHPDLRRILMWDEFVGYPMRKDFKHEDEDRYVAPAR